MAGQSSLFTTIEIKSKLNRRFCPKNRSKSIVHYEIRIVTAIFKWTNHDLVKDVEVLAIALLLMLYSEVLVGAVWKFKKVFSARANCSSLSDTFRISGGGLFHWFGPDTEKPRRPNLSVLARSTTRSPWSDAQLVIHRLGLATINLSTKFEVSISTHYEDTTGNTKIWKMGWFGVVRSYWNSTIRQSTCDFLLAFHSNYVHISHRKYWSKIADLNLPRLYLAPRQGLHHWNFAEIFSFWKLESWATVYSVVCMIVMWQTDTW